VLQGWAFFLVSLVVLNLGYLGVFEVLLWWLLFGHGPRFGLAPLGTEGGREQRAVAARPAGRLVLAAGALAFALMLAKNLLRISDPRRADGFDIALAKTGFSSDLMTLFGQTPVNVFNRDDLELGAAWVVIVESDDHGVPLRTVPFLDRQGGRLDYMRNDYLYFRFSLPWQRSPAERKFVEGDPGRPAAATLALVNKVVDLDVCLTGGSSPRQYQAIVATRTLDDGPLFPVWSAPQLGASFEVQVDGVRAAGIVSGLPPSGCFDLPPGHVGSARRGDDTLSWARALAAMPRSEARGEAADGPEP
jgi:hypothetical protein